MSESHDIRSIAPGMLNAFCPTPGLATGGQPTPQDLDALAQAGYRAVLDIRTPGEPRGFDEPAVVRQAALEYLTLPVGHAPLGDAVFDEFRRVVRDQRHRPLLVHCASGNRVGLLMIPYLILDEGKSPEEAVQLALRGGLSSPQLARLALDYVARQQAAPGEAGQVA